MKENPPQSFPPAKLPKEGEEPVPDTLGLGFNGVRLNVEESDSIWMDLIQFLVDEGLSGLAAKAVGYVNAKEQIQTLNFLADVHMQRKNYGEAQNCLKSIIESEPTNLYSNTLLGHAFFLNGEMGPAQDQYMKTVRLANLTG
jgi:Tfp pilus assembly protein PilF